MNPPGSTSCLTSTIANMVLAGATQSFQKLWSLHGLCRFPFGSHCMTAEHLAVEAAYGRQNHINVLKYVHASPQINRATHVQEVKQGTAWNDESGFM